VRFLLDAQLPLRLARQLSAAGHDVVHASELPDGNRTTDAEIARRADAEDRVVVTKDSDFRASHLLRSKPRRLLIVATGNISNNDLLALFSEHLDAIVAAWTKCASSSCGPTNSWSTRTSDSDGHQSHDPGG
jgi:predicted nuclease of predicted toxin-antitoxin system